jgi:hypothetical protein
MVCNLKAILETSPGLTTVQITCLLNVGGQLYKVKDIERDLLQLAKEKICFQKSKLWYATNPSQCNECKVLKLQIQNLEEQSQKCKEEMDKLLGMFLSKPLTIDCSKSPRHSLTSPRVSLISLRDSHVPISVQILQEDSGIVKDKK